MTLCRVDFQLNNLHSRPISVNKIFSKCSCTCVYTLLFRLFFLRTCLAIGRLCKKSIHSSLRKGEYYSPLQFRGTSKTIGSAIRGFKIGVTQWVRKNTSFHDIWQRDYYEHIVRNDVSFYQIKEYVMHNPKTWEQDKLHPSNIQKTKS